VSSLRIALEVEFLHHCVGFRTGFLLEDRASREAAHHLAVVHIHPVDDFALHKRDGLTEGNIVDRPRSIVQLPGKLPILAFERRDPKVLHLPVIAHADLDREAFRLGGRRVHEGEKVRQGRPCFTHRGQHDGVVLRDVDDLVVPGPFGDCSRVKRRQRADKSDQEDDIHGYAGF